MGKPFRKRYACAFGMLNLSLRETADSDVLEVRVVRKPADRFDQALLIPPGAILKLMSGRTSARFVKVRVFKPRMQYNGRFIAGGELEIER